MLFTSHSLFRLLAFLLFLFSFEEAEAYMPVPDHVVIVVLENHAYGLIAGSASAPYLNGLVADNKGALFTQSFALSHPSQPNYLQLYSGSNQGVTDDNVPAVFPFTTPNLGAELIGAGKTFIGYSEDLPSAGSNVATAANYARKHNPWVNWQGAPTNGIPIASNQPLTSFPSDYTTLPNVSFVIPNLVNDMHDGSDPARISTADDWIKFHLDGYAQWAKTHNSLLIVTFDEDDNASSQLIFTLFLGHMVKHGTYSNHIDHYNVLRTVEDFYSLPHAGAAATATPINYCWDSCYTTSTISASGPLTFCQGGSVTLSTSGGVSRVWSNGSTATNLSVSNSGNYYATVTNANGCTSTVANVVVNSSFGVFNTVLTESMGNVSTTTSIATQESGNGFDNDAYTMTGSADLRITSGSTGYYGATGLANVFFTNTVGKNFIISGINSTGMNNLQLSFGLFKNSTTATGSDFLVTANDGINNYSLSFAALPTGTGTATWYRVTATGTIPSTSSMSLQFK